MRASKFEDVQRQKNRKVKSCLHFYKFYIQIIKKISKFAAKYSIMAQDYPELQRLLDQLPPITLEEMSSIRLMNRTDTKFVTTLPVLEKLLALCQGSYYAQVNCGHQISPYRTVYWDDEQHSMYHRHQAGHKPRTKVRARTYVDSDISFLEIKRKDNHGKTKKKRISVPSIESVMEGEGEEFLKERTDFYFVQPEAGRTAIKARLQNQFQRITLVNKGHTERLTIDFGLCFHNFDSGVDHTLPRTVIIELKRDGRQPSPILPLLRELRIKPAGFSKYCIGTALTNPDVRLNNFKLRLINLRHYL